MKRILVVGCTGMLGAMCLSYLSKKKDIEVWAFSRRSSDPENKRKNLGKEARFIEADSLDQFLGAALDGTYPHFDFLINCIGHIKGRTKETIAGTIDAFEVNTIFPHRLAAAFPNSKIISIQTDCVFAGDRIGGFNEDSKHDAYDLYGRSKSCGEVISDNVYNIRCSIIGPEVYNFYSLLSWVIRQPINAEINGFVSHSWNGISTQVFTQLCYGIIRQDANLKNKQNFVPATVVNKFELVSMIARFYGRSDLKIIPKQTEFLDRSLSTNDPDYNEWLWELAGFKKPPFISQMVEDLAAYKL